MKKKKEQKRKSSQGGKIVSQGKIRRRKRLSEGFSLKERLEKDLAELTQTTAEEQKTLRKELIDQGHSPHSKAFRSQMLDFYIAHNQRRLELLNSKLETISSLIRLSRKQSPSRLSRLTFDKEQTERDISLTNTVLEKDRLTSDRLQGKKPK